MTEIIYRGLKLQSPKGCKYFQVIEGDHDTLVEDIKSSLLTLTYSSDSTSDSLSKGLGIQKLGSTQTMIPTGTSKRIINPIISLNGLKFKKLTYDSHILHLVIVDDSESRVSQDYGYTTIVVSDKDANDLDFINFLFYSGHLAYLVPVGPKIKNYQIRNFPRFVLTGAGELTSESTTIFSLRRKYDDYVIRAVDYQDQFIAEIRKILDWYGIELVRSNKEQTLSKTSYVTYQFNQTPINSSHPRYSDVESNILQHRQPIEFVLRSPDMVLYFDFKNKYSNVDLLTNFCEFKTPDKYGESWTAAIKWGQITEEFNHLYQQDDNSNFSFQCQFRCELFFYEVIDERHGFIEEIVVNLENE